MANISDASGTVRINATHPEVIKNVISLMEIAERFEYGTYLSDYEINEYPEGCKVEIPFSGAGRWCFGNNIEMMFKSIASYIASVKENKEYYGQIFQNVQDSDFEMIFDYCDYEPGCGILGHYVYALSHRAGEDLTAPQITEGDAMEYDFTVENLVDHVGYDLETAIQEMVYRYGEDALEYLENERDFIDNASDKEVEELYEEALIDAGIKNR